MEGNCLLAADLQKSYLDIKLAGTKYLPEEISFSDINSESEENDAPADFIDCTSAAVTTIRMCMDIGKTLKNKI